MLYGNLDPVGTLLSNWRIHAVTPHIKGKQVIDLACGDNRLIRRLGFGVGVDIKDYGRVDLVEKDFSCLPFQDGSIDTVTILAALNYFDDVDAVLVEIHRLLKNEGRLIITFLNKRVSSLWHLFRDRGLPTVAFSREELSSYLHKAGFEIAATHPFMLGLNRIYIIKKSNLD